MPADVKGSHGPKVRTASLPLALTLDVEFYKAWHLWVLAYLRFWRFP